MHELLVKLKEVSTNSKMEKLLSVAQQLYELKWSNDLDY